MNLLKLNHIIEGYYEEELTQKTIDLYRIGTEEEHIQFKNILNVSNIYTSNMNMTEDYKEFFQAFELFRNVFPENLQEDIFYAAKLGFHFKGVPSKLVYLLKKSISTYTSPNVAVSAINRMAWGRFLKRGSIQDGITIKTVIDNLLGEAYTPLSEHRRKVKYRDWYEVYVENVDRVVLLNEEIARSIDSLDDLRNVKFSEEKGVLVYDSPLRVIGPYVGIINDDFDLRKVI